MKTVLYSIIGAVLLGLLPANVVARDSLLGGMNLLPGYEYRPIQGIDSIVGEISKPNGLTISFEKGLVYASGEPRTGGAFLDRPQKLKNSRQIRWYREQIVNGQPVHLAYRNDDWLLVSFPQEGMNLAVVVRDASEMAEALLMIMTCPTVDSATADPKAGDRGGVPEIAGISRSIKTGSYLAIESLLVIDGKKLTGWEVFQVDADFEVELMNDPVGTKGEPIVKYCTEQIRELLHVGDLKSKSVVGARGFTEKGSDYRKETRATYLFEGQWVSEGRVQRYVPSGQFKIELMKSASFKSRKGAAWSPPKTSR